ncbi:MAG TPA: phage portal protein [Pirellulales bacterium]|nr:phage portal protein [Pirellulales bacterium]
MNESIIVGGWTPEPIKAEHDEERLWHSGSPWLEAIRSMVSDSGVTVNQETILQHTPIYAGLLLLGGDIGSLECQQKRIEGDSRINVTDHVAYDIASVRPHARMNPSNFWESVLVNTIIHGNQIAEIDRDNRGRPLAPDPITKHGGLLLHDMTRTGPWYDNTGRLWIKVHERQSDGQLKERMIDPDDTFHLSNLGTNGFWGRGLKDVARDRIGNGIAMVKQANRFMRNGMVPDWVFETDAPMNDQEWEAMVSRLRRDNKGTDNSGNTLLLDSGVKGKPMGLSFEHAQFKELVELDIVMASLLLGIPAVLLNAMAAATFSNVEELYTHYINRTLRKWLKKISEELRWKLLTRLERRRYCFEWDLDPLLKGKLAERYAAYGSGITAMWLARNEVRMKEGLNPLPGLDEIVNPNTTSGGGNDQETEEETTEEPEQTAPDPEQNGQATPENHANTAEKLAMIMKHEDQCVADGVKHHKPVIDWLERFYAGPLRADLDKLTPQSAKDYCDGRLRMYSNFANHVHSQDHFSGLVHAQSRTQSDRVAGLLTAEFAK